MKRLFLPLVMLALLAAPAFAQDPNGSENVAGVEGDVGSNGYTDTHHHRGGGGDNNCGDEKPVAPVPEPGTMALASMGLIALGAAARGRRGAK